MLASSITRKGQVTIPKSIRDRMGVREGEKVLFVERGDEIVIKVLRGTILELKGSVKASKQPEDFGRVRQAVKRAVAAKAARRG